MSDQAVLVSVVVFSGIIVMGLGIYIQKAKAYHLIAGYNTLSDKEKEKFDIKKYALTFRNCFLVMGVLMLAAFPVLRFMHLDKYLSVVAISIIILGVLYLNYVGKVYRKKSH
jgi:Ca2+/Na+ antiporter